MTFFTTHLNLPKQCLLFLLKNYEFACFIWVLCFWMTKSPLRMVLIVLFLSFLSNSVNSNCSYFLYHFLPCEISCYKILDDFFFFHLLYTRRSVLGVHWKDWCWSWNSNTLATSCEELTHWKRPSCWEGFGAGGEGDDRGWDGWMASLTRWIWVWVNSGSWWWTGEPGLLWFMGSQSRTRLSDWTELNWGPF